MLRLLSFGMDYHWAITRGPSKEVTRTFLFNRLHILTDKLGEPGNHVPQAANEQRASAGGLYFYKLPRIHLLPPSVYRRSHHHIQRFHVAGN